MTITTALPSPSPNASGRDRRRYTRVRVTQRVPACIGRGSGTLVDLSANGARVRHASPVALGARVRITFEWNAARFEATAEVLASRVASLGGATQFESRLRFVSIPEQAQEILAAMLTDLVDHDLREWVANLHGWNDGAPRDRSDNDEAPALFIRCRFANGRWQQTSSRDPLPPIDGFTVPAGMSPAEIRTLCRTWETSDDDGRKLVRLITAAVVTQ